MKNKKYLSLILAAMFLTSCSANKTVSKQEISETSSDETTIAEETTVSENATENTTAPETPEIKTLKGCGGSRTDEISEQYASSILCYGFDELPNALDKIVSDTLREKVRSWIEENRVIIDEKYELFKKLAEKNERFDDSFENPNIMIEYKNGYLIITLKINMGLKYDDENYEQDYYSNSTFASIAGYFDCVTEEELTLPELFYDDVDYMSEFNKAVDKALSSPYQFDIAQVGYIEQKRPFSGLTDDMFVFEGSNLCINYDNPFFPYGIEYINVDSNFLCENCVLFRYRDCSDAINDEIYENSISIYNFESKSDGMYKNVSFDNIIADSRVWDAEKVEKINKFAKDFAATEEFEENMRTVFNQSVNDPVEDEDGYFNGVLMSVHPDADYNFFEINVHKTVGGDCSAGYTNIYDADTLERLSNTEILEKTIGDDYAQKLTFDYYNYDENGNFNDCAYTKEEILENIDNLYLNTIGIGDYGGTYIFLVETPIENEFNYKTYYFRYDAEED